MARDPRVKVRIEATDSTTGAVRSATTGFDRVEKSANNAGKSITRLGDAGAGATTRLGRFSAFLKQRLVFTFGEVVRAAQAAGRAIREAANLEGTRRALEIQLEATEQTLDQFLAKLDEVARGTISSAELISSSARAILLGIPIEQIASLLEIARASAIATGESVSKAFADITTGIGRASPLILDNLGIIINLTEAYGTAAAAIGKTAEQLTQAEKSQALLNGVLAIGKDRVEQFGDAASTTAETLARASAAANNLKDAIFGAFGKVTNALFLALQAVIKDLQRDFQRLVLVGLKVKEFFTDLTESQAKLRISLLDSNIELLKQSQDLSKLADALFRSALGADDDTEATKRNTRARIENRRETEGASDGAEEFTDVLDFLTIAQDRNRIATEGATRALLAQATAAASFRGDFALQAAERRARLGGSSIGGPLISTGSPSGGTFTVIRAAEARSDGGLRF